MTNKGKYPAGSDLLIDTDGSISWATMLKLLIAFYVTSPVALVAAALIWFVPVSVLMAFLQGVAA